MNHEEKTLSQAVIKKPSYNNQQLLLAAYAELSKFASARLDADILLSFVLNQPRSWLYAWPEQEVSKSAQTAYYKLIKLRKQGMPIAYLTGYCEFWSMKIKVSKDVLIPRPETELLVELLSKKINHDVRILELGTGSGAIALSLASICRTCYISAVDHSAAALWLAQENATEHQLDNIKFVLSNWYSNLKPQKYDFIVANPPYIGANDEDLEEGVKAYEPQEALIAENNGLADLEKIIIGSLDYLIPGGSIYLEHGYRQGREVRILFNSYGFDKIITFKDIGARERVTAATR